MPTTTEFGCRIYNDATGDYVSIQHDSECDLFTIEANNNGETEGRVVLTRELARKAVHGLSRVIDLNTVAKSATGGDVDADVFAHAKRAVVSFRDRQAENS